MEISFKGIGQVAATFEADGDIRPGMAVALTGAGKVGKGKAGDLPCGVVLSVKNDMACVQIGGMAEVSWSGTAPSVGFGALACDGAGKLKTVSSGGITCMIASVNTADSTAVVKL